jgi:hypothetical protein
MKPAMRLSDFGDPAFDPAGAGESETTSLSGLRPWKYQARQGAGERLSAIEAKAALRGTNPRMTAKVGGATALAAKALVIKA